MQIRQEQLLFAQLKRVRHLCVILLFAKYKQCGLSGVNQISPVCITLPISYPASHVSASVIDWGAAGKAYGVNLEQSVLNIVAPETPFSAFWISIGY